MVCGQTLEKKRQRSVGGKETNATRLRRSHLSGKDPAQADDDEDVEDRRADDCPHADVSFGDEDA